jgi:hypothetical protein
VAVEVHKVIVLVATCRGPIGVVVISVTARRK